MTDSSVRAEASRLLEGSLAQLRHAYQQLLAVENMGHRQAQSLADGLIAPEVRRLERLQSLLAEGPDPETITRLRQWQAEYKRQAEIRLPSQLENSAWQIVSDLLAGLGEKK
jgi:hypothetical protein